MTMKVSNKYMNNYNELLNDLLNKLNELRTKYHEIKISVDTYTDLTIIQVDLTNFCTSDFIIVFGIDDMSFYRNGELIINGSFMWYSCEVVEIIINTINDICVDLCESE